RQGVGKAGSSGKSARSGKMQDIGSVLAFDPGVAGLASRMGGDGSAGKWTSCRASRQIERTAGSGHNLKRVVLGDGQVLRFDFERGPGATFESVSIRRPDGESELAAFRGRARQGSIGGERHAVRQVTRGQIEGIG